MKMYLCMFLSVLASTTAAPNLREVAERQWSTYLAGDIAGFIATYADDAKLHWTLNEFKFSGQLGQNGMTMEKVLTEVTAQFELGPPSLEGEYFSDNGHTMLYDVSFTSRDKISGSRQYHRQFHRIEVNEAGLVSSATWTPYSVEDIDASAVGTKLYTQWAASDPAVFNLIDENWVLRVSGNRVAELNGVTHGTAEFAAYMQKSEKHVTYQDVSQLKFKVSANSPDGLSASSVCTADVVYKNGAKMTNTVYQTWTVNSAGKIVSLDSVVKTDTPLNARGAWDLIIDQFYAGNLKGVFDRMSEDMTIHVGGDAQGYLKYSPWKELVPSFSVASPMSKKEYADNVAESLVMAPFTKLEFTYLAQGDYALTVRYDLVTKYQGNVVSMIADHEFEFNDDFLCSKIYVNVVSVAAVPEKGGL